MHSKMLSINYLNDAIELAIDLNFYNYALMVGQTIIVTKYWKFEKKKMTN